ncbi:GIY-YIG nuclease family protein [Motilimonas eburnea]|uniref:GIY-YIG nuclease family protein n=1 Tax=Motilimonas eburnea TaxID=1737488 RepID=UPI001E52E090|nr:GIY-YIG nuclease family protein [Motilimonas eburnea]MCE2571822.1 GIY-YIG nuclease family protein [Motilimonas eburnea]
MNALKKYVLQRFNAMSKPERIYIICKITETDFYKDYCLKNRNRVVHFYLYNNAINAYLVRYFEGGTIHGRRSPFDQTHENDRLSLITYQLPSTVFIHSKDSSFEPLFHKVKTTELVRPFKVKQYESAMIKAWLKAQPFLASSSMDPQGSYSLARLNYSNVFSSKQDVYFILDEENSMVKIGITSDLKNRLKAIKAQYRTGDLEVVSVVHAGGVEVERFLHHYFSDLQVKQAGKGNEWFHYCEVLYEFIRSLNECPIKSEFIAKLMQKTSAAVA